jgi:hypothetical protein
MSAEKLVTIFGLEGAIETAYGDATTPDQDILMKEKAVLAIDYAHDGERGPAPGAGGMLLRAVPSGASGSFAPVVVGRGFGAAYTDGSEILDFDVLMQACGHAATASGTPTIIEYDPVSALAAFESGSFALYGHGQKYLLNGAYGSLDFAMEVGAFLEFTFNLQGIVTTMPSDDVATAPALVYMAPTLIPPKAENITATLNGVADLVIRSVSFNQNREIDPRLGMIGANAHAGFSAGRRAPTMEWVVEAVEPISGFNPYTLRDAGTKLSSCDFTIGVDTDKNAIKFEAAQAYITNVEDGEDGATALWTISMALSSSTPILDDDYKFTWLDA